jgi:hypothetical protein
MWARSLYGTPSLPEHRNNHKDTKTQRASGEDWAQIVGEVQHFEWSPFYGEFIIALCLCVFVVIC